MEIEILPFKIQGAEWKLKFCPLKSRGHPSSKVWHRCRFKPPNCRLARAARVVCAQPGTVVCSQTPLSLVVCWSGGGGGWGGGGC